MAESFRARKHHIELIDAKRDETQLDLALFQLIVVAAPIHSVAYSKAIVRFARENRTLFGTVQTVFVSVGLAVASRVSDGRAQTLEVVDKFITATGWRPKRVELVAGALADSKYTFAIRFVMRRIAASQSGDTDTSRDYEYTDWAALDALALDLARGIEPTRPAASAQLSA